MGKLFSLQLTLVEPKPSLEAIHPKVSSDSVMQKGNHPVSFFYVALPYGHH
jgi:hypothetical protein